MTDESTSDQPAPIELGTVLLPPGDGTPVGSFSFICNRAGGAQVEIGTPVVAATTEGDLIGTVIDMRTVGKDKTPIGAELRAGFNAPTATTDEEVVVAEVQVFWSQHLRSPRAGTVRAANRDEVARAAGADTFTRHVPAGLVALAGGGFAPVSLDADNLIGPDAAHLVVGGRSGAAAKTSFMGVLLRSVLHHQNQNLDEDDLADGTAGVGALVFNVKGEDLIWLDQPAEGKGKLSDDDDAMYEALGIPPEPFSNVTVWGACIPNSDTVTRSPRIDARPLRWDLERIFRYLHYLFPELHGPEGERTQSFLMDYEDAYIRKARGGAATFNQLREFFENQFDQHSEEERDSGDGWRGHHLSTLRKARRMLMNLPTRTGGLVANGATTESEDIPVEGWTPGQVHVVDLAGIEPFTQGLVIARTLERLLRSAEESRLGVGSVIVVTDELNAFAPAQGDEMRSVKKILKKTSTQGRYAGVSLWGAAQALSKVDDLVVDNAATRALGVTSERELSSPTFRGVPRGLAERILTLPRGQMALWHAGFREALVVKFPRPAWKTGRSKRREERRDIDVLAGLGEREREALTEGLTDEQVRNINAQSDDLDDLRTRLEKARIPDMHKQVVTAPFTVDPNDPFDLGI